MRTPKLDSYDYSSYQQSTREAPILKVNDIQFLKCLQGYINWNLDHVADVTIEEIFYDISHDISGTMKNEPGFSCRIYGYSKYAEPKKNDCTHDFLIIGSTFAFPKSDVKRCKKCGKMVTSEKA